MTLSATHNSTRTIQTSVEIAHKLEQLRNALDETGAAGIRLRGTDWFSWATAGACHTVLLAAETGVAEVLVTHDGAWILTSEIEAQRFKDEELPDRADLVGGMSCSFIPGSTQNSGRASLRR